MTCPDEPELGRFLNMELAPGRAGDVERHVGACPRCQQFLDLLVRRSTPRDVLGELGTEPGPGGVPSVPGFELLEPIGRFR